MKNYHSYIRLLPVLLCMVLFACRQDAKEPALKEENITYKLDTVMMDGYVVYDENIKGKRPAVLIVHEWWGLNDYMKSRARDIARLGYFAFAVDLYGNGRRADNPTDAGNLATPFYQNPEMARNHFDAALQKLKEYRQADQEKIAAIGYCFGGGMVLNFARMGSDLTGVVSFHGSLLGTPAVKDLLKAKILVCHGDADPLVPADEVNTFKQQMDSIGADYTWKAYPGALHAFTNPNATALGEKYHLPIKYDAAADSASWQDMKDFFNRIFK